MIRIEPAGAEALLLVLAEQPDAHLPQRIAVLAERIRAELGAVLTDLVPGWTSLLLHYDLMRTDHLQLAERLAAAAGALAGRAVCGASAGGCMKSPSAMAVKTSPKWPGSAGSASRR